MRKEYALDFWRTYLPYVLSGSDDTVTNPAIEFTRQAKAGDFDSLSDEEYDIRLQDVEEASKLFLNKSKCNTITLFNRALNSTPLTAEEQEVLVRTLASASSRIDYTKLSTEKTEGISDALRAYTPQDLYQYLSANIYGQDEARKSASMLVYNHLQGRRRNAVFAGPTGCGKSEIWRTLSRKIPYIRIFDATSLSADGWKGSLHWRGIFESVPKKLRESMIIVLDEADKMLEPAIGSGGMDFSMIVQNILLRIMDGDTVTFESTDKQDGFSVDCSGVSVVLLGAFETLLTHKSRTDNRSAIGFNSSGIRHRDCDYNNTIITIEDLVCHGNMRREVAGRIHSITQLHTMTEGDFLTLLDTPHISPADRLSSDYGISITLSDAMKRQLCRQASESRLGVRYIRSQIQQMVDDMLYKDCTRDECYLDIEDTEGTRSPAIAS